MWGKAFGFIIGACATTLVNWPVEGVAVASLLGAMAGHLWLDEPMSREQTRRRTRQSVSRPLQEPPPPDNPEQRAMAQALCPLFIELARADGTVNQNEIRVVREFFQLRLSFGEMGSEWVRLALKEALTSPPQDISVLSKDARIYLPPGLRLDFVQALYDMAQVDGQISKSETDQLKIIMAQINLSDEQLQSITAKFFGTATAHYDALQISSEATDEEVKSAFRKLAVEFHPDKFATQSPIEIEEAAHKFRAAKDAYEALKKIRGF
jgi:DnaJ like chaperone protein